MRTVTVPLPAPSGRPLHRLVVTHGRTDLRRPLTVGDQVLLVDADGLGPARAGTVTRVLSPAAGAPDVAATRYEIACGVSDLVWGTDGVVGRPTVHHRPTVGALPASSVETTDVEDLLLVLRDRPRGAPRPRLLAVPAPGA